MIARNASILSQSVVTISRGCSGVVVTDNLRVNRQAIAGCKILAHDTCIMFSSGRDNALKVRLPETTAAEQQESSSGGALPKQMRHEDLAQLDGHATRCVGAMLSSMIGDVLGGLCVAFSKARQALEMKLKLKKCVSASHTMCRNRLTARLSASELPLPL